MLLELSDLVVRYGGAEVLKGISLGVPQGEIVTLIGSNGAGKTTTLRIISGLKIAVSGEIWFEGTRIDRISPQEIVKKGIGHAPQGRALFPYMTVLENLRLGSFLRRDKGVINRDLETTYEYFPRLKERRQQRARTLSGGEQQMLTIARALMGKPKLLMLDEPSLGLSPLMVREIGRVVVNINRNGTSVLLVEQNAQLALKLAHRGYVLETGIIVLQGKTEDLLQGEIVKRAYFGQQVGLSSS
jgi:branched-chain amino acid transport system ATP-binding protein